MNCLEVRDVSYSVGEKSILSHVSFGVSAGEFVALIGPNGAGKSTLFSVIAGDVAPCAGDVQLMGDSVSTLSELGQSRRRAVQLQHQSVAYSYLVREVVEMGRRPWTGTPYAADDEAAVLEAIGLADMSGFEARDVTTLSGGEQARVSYARTCAQRTRIVLADEPTAALDLGHQEALLTSLRSRAGRGAAVVTVLHDLTLAASYADRVVLLNAGKIEAIGTPVEVLTGERLSRVYSTPIEVFPHPVTGALLVLPDRNYARKKAHEHAAV